MSHKQNILCHLNYDMQISLPLLRWKVYFIFMGLYLPGTYVAYMKSNETFGRYGYYEYSG